MSAVTDYSALVSGYNWYVSGSVGKPTILTYSFEQSSPSYFSEQYASAASTFAPLNESEKAVVRSALDAWSAVSGITFLETTRHQGDITFAFYNLDLTGGSNAAGQASYPMSFAYSGSSTGLYSSDYLNGGDVWFDTDYRASSSFIGDFKHVALHEIGHALGLKHPFDVTTGHSETLTAEADKGSNTVMSYDFNVRSGELGPLDVAAIQYLYGLPATKGTQFASWGFDAITERMIAHGTAAGELLRGTGTDDLLYTGGGRDYVYTAQGNDIIIGDGSIFDVNGGPGIDTVVLGIEKPAPNSISDSGGSKYIYRGGEFQRLDSIERIVFTNDTIAFDIQGNAGQVYRLYQAAFDRTPDIGGLSAHINAVDHGLSLHNDAASFIASPEFALRYGSNTSDQQFVTALYNNVLDRAPDAGGNANWLIQLSTHTLDRASVLIAFSESPENHARVDPTIAAGIHLDYAVFT